MMRKGYSLLLLLLCCSWVSAQNWAPINTTDKYNYKLDTASAISHTLWVDSVTLSGSDTVYWMNRIVKTISYWKALRNQPQFLQEKMVVKPNGSYCFLMPGSIGYSPFLALGDSIQYDTTNNISAKVIAIRLSIVLGNPDSIKTFLLSSGDTLVVSKNYGFVQYPFTYGSHKYYRLVGIEDGRSIGEQLAKFADFFNFKKGDKLWYYMHGISDADYTPSSFSHEKVACTIDTVINRNDTTFYNGLQLFSNNLGPIYNSGSWQSFFVVNNHESELNLYPNTCLAVSRRISQGYYPQLDSFDYTSYLYNMPFDVKTPIVNTSNCNTQFVPTHYYKGFYSYKDSSNRSVKVFSGIYFERSPSNDTLDYCLDNNYRCFTQGLGLTHYAASGFEQLGESRLYAYQYANDLTWTILDSNALIGVEAINENVINVLLKPNPIAASLFVDFVSPNKQLATIHILNLNGTELITQQSSDSHIEINTTSLPAGMYIVEVRTKDGVARKKIIKL